MLGNRLGSRAADSRLGSKAVDSRRRLWMDPWTGNVAKLGLGMSW